jgi:hypothetical protein
MRAWLSFGMSASLFVVLASTAWADCSWNEAENLNRQVPAKIVTAKASDEWTSEMEKGLEEIGKQFDRINEKHTAAGAADDPTDLNEICGGYRELLVQIDELSKPSK